jgi:putative hydrolase of the HAD superfamily
MKKLSEYDNQELKFIESSKVKDGVVCDIYEFINDNSKDLGIVTVEKGYKTPLQLVVGGEKTVEIFQQGQGVLTIIDQNGNKSAYNFPSEQAEVNVKVGEKMQWEAIDDLVFAEICYPPYKDGRFKNLPSIVLIDVDGVVLRPRDKYFSQRLNEDGYDIDDKKVSEFFKNQYKDIVVGKAQLEEELAKVASDWGWERTVDELLEYWFSYENHMDQNVIDFVQKLRQDGIKCYLASDHSKYRKQDLLNNVGLAQYFDGAFFSSDVGFTKEDKEYYAQVLEQIDLAPDEILFVDDDSKNVEIAKSVLPNALTFTTIENLKENIYA